MMSSRHSRLRNLSFSYVDAVGNAYAVPEEAQISHDSVVT